MRIETDFGLIIERTVDDNGADLIIVTDESGDKAITLFEDQYVELYHSVGLMTNWNDGI